MTEQLTPKEYLTLQHLADGKDHGKSPDSLTDAQYYSALKSLKNKDMVYAAFVEGGEVYAAQIKTNGKAILDDLSDEANYIIRKLIKKENITDAQFLLLKVARDNNGAKNVFGITNKSMKNIVSKLLRTSSQPTTLAISKIRMAIHLTTNKSFMHLRNSLMMKR